MQRLSDTSVRWLVHASDVARLCGDSLDGFRTPRLPCLTGSAVRSLRSSGIAGTSNSAGKRHWWMSSFSGSNASPVSSIEHCK
eukprot:12835361-Ditylum_brightwellii.AAC.1